MDSKIAVIHKHTHKEIIMFTFDSYIDAIQGAKKTFVETYIKDEKFKAELNKLVDAQTKFAKGSVQSTLDIAQSFVKNFNDTVYSKKAA
jgi:hypothetical protein